MRKLLFMASAALLVLMMFSGLLMTPGTAHAASVQTQTQTHATALAPMHPLMPAVTCSGNGCTGLDPIQTGCSASASTVLSKGIFNSSGQQIGTINLRFSSVCQTNWAQFLTVSPFEVNASVEREGGADGSLVLECEPVDCGATNIDTNDAFTDMVWAPDVPALAAGSIINVGNVCVTQDPNGLPCTAFD